MKPEEIRKIALRCCEQFDYGSEEGKRVRRFYEGMLHALDLLETE